MISLTSANPFSTSALPAQTDTQISYAVLGKALDSERQEGASLVGLINNASNGSGQGIQPGDPLVAKATGVGGLLDTFA